MYNTPKNIKFTRTHEWISTDTNEQRMGITEHAQDCLGDMVFVELPKVGTIVQAGDELGVIESVKAASDFYAPISGVVVAINDAINDTPALVNTDPYGAGWLVILRPNAQETHAHLLDSEAYHTVINEEC